MDALGCVRDSVATMPTTVLGADLTVVSAATNNSDDQSIAVVSMTSSLVLDPTVSPEDLGSHVAVDLLATNRSSPLNATLAVWNAALSSELLPIQAIKAAVSAGLAVGAPVAAFSALAELALSSLSVKEIITGITQGVLMSVNDTARLTGILSAALDGVSSTALMQSMSDPVGSRRLATDTPASRMGDTVAEMASSIGGQLPTQDFGISGAGRSTCCRQVRTWGLSCHRDSDVQGQGHTSDLHALKPYLLVTPCLHGPTVIAKERASAQYRHA